MKPGPSKLAESLVGALLPPACREEVLGDLYERYAGPSRYAVDAVRTVPMVVASRIYRTADAQMVLLEAMAMYLAYLASAWYLDQRFLASDQGLMQLAIPAAASLVVLIVGNAYAGTGKASPRRTLVSAVLGVCVALFGAVPRLILICGGTSAALLTFALRLMFPPVTRSTRSAGAPDLRSDDVPISPRAVAPFAIAVLLWAIYQMGKRK